MLFPSISFHYSIDEKKKKQDPGPGPVSAWSLHGLPCLCGFPPGAPVSSHIPQLCLHCPGLSVGVCDASLMEECPVQGGAHLVP